MLKILARATPTTMDIGTFIDKMQEHGIRPTVYARSADGQWLFVILLDGQKQIVKTVDQVSRKGHYKPNELDRLTKT